MPLLFIPLFFLMVQQVISQESFTRRYTINEGLPGNSIHSIFKDQFGFLWLGTNSGLARFNGTNFHYYTAQDGMAGQKVTHIAEDAHGNLWLACGEKGLSIFDGVDFYNYNTSSGLINNEITAFHYIEETDEMMIGTENGLSVYRSNGFSSFHQQLNNINQRLQVTDFLRQDDNILVYTHQNGSFRYNLFTRQLEKIKTSPLNYQAIKKVLIRSNKDTLFIEPGNKMHIYGENKKTRQFKNIQSSLDIVLDHSGNIWMLAEEKADDATKLFKVNNDQIIDYTSQLGLENSGAQSLFFDAANKTLWIGSSNGLYAYSGETFNYFSLRHPENEGAQIKDLFADEQHLVYLLFEKKLLIKEPQGNLLTINIDVFQDFYRSFQNKELDVKYYYLKDKTGSYEKYKKLIKNGSYNYLNPYFNNRTNSIIEAGKLYKPNYYQILKDREIVSLEKVVNDDHGNVWIGTNAGLFRLDEQYHIKEFYDIPNPYLEDFHINNNILFARAWKNLYVIHNFPFSKKMKVYDTYTDHCPMDVSAMHSKDSTVYFGTKDNGLYIWLKDSFYHYDDEEHHLSAGITSIATDTTGRVYFSCNDGTVKAGSLKNDSRFQISKTISRKDGLQAANIYWLHLSNKHSLWVGTNEGMYLIQGLNRPNETYSIHHFGKQRGYIDFESMVSQLNDNTIFAASSNLLTEIEIHKILSNLHKKSKVYLTEVKYNNRVLPFSKNRIPLNFKSDTTLEFPFKDNSFNFSFDAIHYSNSNNTRFSCKLEGYDDEWTPKSKEKSLSYANLPIGTYTLKVRSFSSFSSTYQETELLKIRIQKPIWYNWWFILPLAILGAGFLGLVLYAFSAYIKHRERRRSEIKERIIEYETKALRAQMNPHFIFNAINSIQNYMLDNDLDAALGYLSDFAKLIRITLDNVSRKRVSLEEELNYLNYYLRLEKMRFDNKFHAEINIDNEIEKANIYLPPMIIQPFLENAIKHGIMHKQEPGKIIIRFFIQNQRLVCEVTDNGIGRKKSREIYRSQKTGHKSKGTYITNERIAMLNQMQGRNLYSIQVEDLYDAYNLAQGTRVRIEMPLVKDF